jgi:hypothetical protein
MPTDLLLAFERRLTAERAAAEEHRTGVLVLPLTMALLTILLSARSHAFACAVIELGLQ